ncbi:hypothetical protein JYT15_00260 [Acidimicrobium ferrooxidans]|nr:hypothetical protein [Acidimicrobium ferrooxidans]
MFIVERRAEMPRKEVVARLLESKKESEEKSHEWGWNAGKKWAEDQAEWPDLERLDRHYADARWDLFCGQPPAPHTHASLLYCHIFGLHRDETDPRDAHEFWEVVFGDENPGEGLLRGFCEAAIEVLEQVRAAI